MSVTSKSVRSSVKFNDADSLNEKSKKGKDKDSASVKALTDGAPEDSAEGAEEKTGESSKEKDKQGRLGDAAIFFPEDSAFFKKWSGPLILGPFFPYIIAVLVIVSGQLVLLTWTGNCGFPLNAFIQVAVGISYLFVLLYTWVFLGDTFRLKIPIFDLNFPILVPFSSLQWLLVIDVILFFVSFIVWCVGTSILKNGYLCALSAPALYSYTVFIVAIYWLGFCITIIYIVKLFYGDFLTKMIKEQVRAPTIAELEDRVFRKAYNQFDKEREGHISKDDVGNLLQVLGVYVPENELPALLTSFDPTESGIVEFDALYEWFKQLNSSADKEGGGDGDDKDDGMSYK